MFGGMPVLTPIKPLGDPKQPHPNEVWDNVKTATELADTVKELAEHGLKTVGSIASIVGAVGVVLELLDSAGLFGRKTTLDDVLKIAWDNFLATVAASQISHLQNMAPHVATVQGALDAVETFAQGTGTRQDLAQFDHDMVVATNALTDAAFQLVVFNYAEYVKFPWLWEDQWLNVPPRRGRRAAAPQSPALPRHGERHAALRLPVCDRRRHLCRDDQIDDDARDRAGVPLDQTLPRATADDLRSAEGTADEVAAVDAVAVASIGRRAAADHDLEREPVVVIRAGRRRRYLHRHLRLDAEV